MCKILHQKCEKSAAKDKSLPLNSYLVTYVSGDETFYDIVICNKRVEIFNMYWDEYREDLKDIRWTDGGVNPKFWKSKPEGKKK